ncbi:MAG: DUF2110 family protein [Promethearchaeota archaeon]
MTNISVITLESIDAYPGSRIFKRLIRTFKDDLSRSLEVFDIDYQVREIIIKDSWHLEISLDGEDAFAARNYINLKYGMLLNGTELKSGMLIHKAKVKEPLKMGFGIFFDIGLKERGKDALFSLHEMRRQLINGKKAPSRKIARYFGFCEGFSYPVRVLNINDKGEVFINLDARFSGMMRRWIDDGMDVVFCHGDTKERLHRELKRIFKDKLPVMVDDLGLFDCTITCKKKTDGAGIVSLLGPKLSHVKFSVLNSKMIKKLFI